MSRACRALLTSGSTIVPGANYFLKYVLRVLQHLCTPYNACVTGNCVYMSKSRQPGRQMTWSHAVLAFMVRYAAGNAFATAKALGLVDDKTTMWEFQWDILKQRYFSGAEFNNTTKTAAVPTVHAPKRFASRLLCKHCRNGSTRWACGACGKHMHIECFEDTHDV